MKRLLILALLFLPHLSHADDALHHFLFSSIPDYFAGVKKHPIAVGGIEVINGETFACVSDWPREQSEMKTGVHYMIPNSAEAMAGPKDLVFCGSSSDVAQVQQREKQLAAAQESEVYPLEYKQYKTCFVGKVDRTSLSAGSAALYMNQKVSGRTSIIKIISDKGWNTRSSFAETLQQVMNYCLDRDAHNLCVCEQNIRTYENLLDGTSYR